MTTATATVVTTTTARTAMARTATSSMGVVSPYTVYVAKKPYKPLSDRPGCAVWDRFAVWHPISHLHTLAPV